MILFAGVCVHTLPDCVHTLPDVDNNNNNNNQSYHIPHLPVPSIFGTRGRSLPDIFSTGSLVPNRELEDEGYIAIWVDDNGR